MSGKYLILGALIASLAAPASAGTYYVAVSSKTKNCMVTTKKPNGKTATLVGADTYKTKKGAQTAMKSASDCTK